MTEVRAGKLLRQGYANPRKQWMKASAASDVAHYIIWHSSVELRTSCEMVLEAERACPVRIGARLCEVCRKNLKDRERAIDSKRFRRS